MSAVEKQTWTVEQYLEMERASEEKHEYLNGEIFLMAGGTGNHNAISINAGGSLMVALRKTPCKTFSSDQRVLITDTGLYTYPDITVVCEPPIWRDNRRDTLINPTLIIEVLSPSTQAYDRDKKFRHYRTLDSLKEYVLISQNEPRIVRYLRQPNDEWLFAEVLGLDASIDLTSIGCVLALADVYDKIDFEESESE